MSLNAPKLDDRTFQELVDEVRKRIPHYTDEWTDHNVSDPGVTLIELFAWLTSTTLYRLNRVPDRHYIKFMEMLGLTLDPPIPARAPVTFWLTAAANNDVVIPAGTEVASIQTETEPSIVFTTNADLTVTPPKLTDVFSETGQKRKQFSKGLNIRRLQASLGRDAFGVFSNTPVVDDALYLGFSNDVGRHVLRLETEWVTAGGAGVDPLKQPPLVWEASTGDNEQRWRRCTVETDTTEGLNRNGRLQIHTPSMGRFRMNAKNRYWVRVRVKEISASETRAGMRPYQVSPRLRQLAVTAWGGTVEATHSQINRDEVLGQSDGSPGQRFYLKTTPILSRREDEHLFVTVEGEPAEAWHETSDFADGTAGDRHYTLDSVTGEVQFGPAIRQRDGTIKRYGAIPPRNARLRFAHYRSGGGDKGNVDRDILTTLKTAIPYIDHVSNLAPAEGGRDAQSLEDAMVQAPRVLRHRERAVTVDDYEDIARSTPGIIVGRVKCLQPEPSDTGQVAPGQVYVLLIPEVRHRASFIPPEQLEPGDEQISRLRAHLDARRLLTTRLYINAPDYKWVAARVFLRAAGDTYRDLVETEVLRRLYRFLNPLTGGPDGRGWPFGRALYPSDVYQCLQGLPHVHFVREVQLFAVEPGGSPDGEPEERLDLVRHGVIASGQHEVEFVT